MIRILTDSSADLSPAVAAEHRIEVVPLTIRFGTDEFVDRHDLTADAFWARLGRSDTLPTTAAPSAGAFQDAYQRLAESGAGGVVAVCISQKLSGTYQAAALAARRAPIPVHVIDSGTASLPLGLTAIAASEAARLGADLADVAAAVAGADTDLLATLDTLEYLQKGGRIGPAAALFGGLLDVKPLIGIQDGLVVAAGRVRTRRKALKALLDWLVDKRGVTGLGVVHGNAPDIDVFLDQLGERFPDVAPLVSLAGPVIGTHAGPGFIGVAVTRS